MLTEHPLLSEPSSVSFYNWMSNAVGNRTGAGCQESPVARSNHNVLQTGQVVPSKRRCNFVCDGQQITTGVIYFDLFQIYFYCLLSTSYQHVSR